MTRETVGKISHDLQGKTDEKAPNVIELERGMQEDYLKNLMDCVENAYDNYPDTFYVVVITKRERLMPNVFRNYFVARQTCPLPFFDETVYTFSKATGDLSYLWTVPSKQTCEYLKEHALEVCDAEKELLYFVLQFIDGTLFRKAKMLNGEELESPLLIQ